MSRALHLKRMSRERPELEQENSDYFVHFKDDDLLKFEAYVFGPGDSLYEHKFVKLRFEIPNEYPFKPPVVTFIQHTGSRIHPNLYVEGKVCLSILGTWPGDPWAHCMKCHTVLITIRSLLDSQPYKHEPGCSDHPEFNKYVQYSTWRCLLLDYLERETVEPAKAFLQKHLRDQGAKMLQEVRRQEKANSTLTQFINPYIYGRPLPTPDYPGLIRDLTAAIKIAELLSDSAKKRQLDLTLTLPCPTPASDASEPGRRKRTRTATSSAEFIEIEDVLEITEPPEMPAKKAARKAAPDSAGPKRSEKKKGAPEVIDLT